MHMHYIFELFSTQDQNTIPVKLTRGENQPIIVLLANRLRVHRHTSAIGRCHHIFARQNLEQSLHVHLRQSINTRQPRRRSRAGAHAQPRALRLRHRRLAVLADVQMGHTCRHRLANEHLVQGQIRQCLLHLRIVAHAFVGAQRQRSLIGIARRCRCVRFVQIDGRRQVAVLAEQRDLDARSAHPFEVTLWRRRNAVETLAPII